MIRSMTAFADGQITVNNLTILCELRSVNHRYNDISVKLPDCLRFAELDIRRLISDKLKRGKIECGLSFKKQPGNQNFNIDMQTVGNLMAAAAKIEAAMPHPAPFSALEVLQFPGIQQENEIDKETLKQSVVTLLDNTLEQMLDTRTREGVQLAALIGERCEKIAELVEFGRKRMPDVLSNLRSKLVGRIQELVAEPNFDRLEQELVLLAQKLDVAEELDRLQAHLAEVLRALKQNEPMGRRLDFLMQEMNREANTLGSKSSDREMTQISIDLKVLIEQMREQIQNIE
ncbi:MULTISPECIES: YicC/YloC family endoribonuclease [Methylomonas]|uniref:YicC/YloC family endoribonuclease n=1 Tax=Methylomonas TaxID=416 RepID=UPI001231903D|nr:YicC/YloC family endoribonuclease [Methylomonas rhizoryzae]